MERLMGIAMKDVKQRILLKRKILLKVALPPLLLVIVAIALYLFNARDPADTYLTAKVERGDIEDTVSALGTLQPVTYVDVGTQVTGQLKTLHATIGGLVKKGQLIATIDPILFDSKAGMTEASLHSAQAQLAEKQVQQRLAQQLYDRNKNLYESQAVSEELLEQSKAALDAAEQQTQQQQAQVAQMQAQLKGDRANLSYTRIFAPMSGTVVSINARQGQTLVSNQTASIIMRIADLNTMTVWAQVSEADVPKITVNKPVTFSPLGLPNRRWHSKVRQVLPTPEIINSVVLYDVLFDVPNTERLLQPQMTVQSNFVIAKSENTLLVPVTALVPVSKHRKAKDDKPDQGKEEAPVKEAALIEKQVQEALEKAKNEKEKNKAAKDKTAKGGKNDPKEEEQNAKHGKADAGSEHLSETSKHKYMVRVLTESGQVEERKVVVGVMSRLKAEILSGLSEGESVIIGMPDDGTSKKNRPKKSKAAKL
jgi:macrolide-specific efflux system membrane fusion protein